MWPSDSGKINAAASRRQHLQDRAAGIVHRHQVIALYQPRAPPVERL